jgi:hypothetical protein
MISPPFGNVARIADTVFDAIVIGAGQAAPLVAAAQLAEILPIDAGSTSLKVAPLAALGPVLRILSW